jgi:murein DD-endopeptidase MepM/ murein hydrolase activator NlpD
MVVISTPNGKFWSLSAHLSGINVSVGQSVDEDTLIGWAGSTGFADPYPHVHQVFYRWPSSSFGRPYGGRGLKQTHLTYIGHGGGVYHSFSKGKWTSW